MTTLRTRTRHCQSVSLKFSLETLFAAICSFSHACRIPTRLVGHIQSYSNMALASAPSTPNRTGAPAVRRSFTAPSKPLKAFNPLKEAEAQGAETLYAHSSGKIVSFSTSNRPLRHSSVGDTKSEFQDEPVGVLPWASITERTVAAGVSSPRRSS